MNSPVRDDRWQRSVNIERQKDDSQHVSDVLFHRDRINSLKEALRSAGCSCEMIRDEPNEKYIKSDELDELAKRFRVIANALEHYAKAGRKARGE